MQIHVHVDRIDAASVVDHNVVPCRRRIGGDHHAAGGCRQNGGAGGGSDINTLVVAGCTLRW